MSTVVWDCWLILHSVPRKTSFLVHMILLQLVGCGPSSLSLLLHILDLNSLMLQSEDALFKKHGCIS